MAILGLTLRVLNPVVSPSPESEVMLEAIAENKGDRWLDLKLETSDLYIDGAPSLEWRLAIGNGPRDPKEGALPPGDKVEFRRNLSPSILKTPGTHELRLSILGTDSAPVTVELEAAPDSGGGDRQ